jgi:hypothetical protein
VRQPPPSGRVQRTVEEVAADLIAAHRRRRRDPGWQPPRADLVGDLAALLGLPPGLPLPGADAPPRPAPREPVAPAPVPPPRTTRETPAPPRPADVYGDVRGAFQRNEAWLRRQASVMDKVVERMRVDPTTGEAAVGPVQRELRIALPPGGAGRGYFALRNGHDRTREITVEVARHRGLPPGVAEPPAVRVEPERLTLAPGETQEIAVRVDLAGCALRSHDEVEIGLRAQGGDAVVAFVWVVLVVEETRADD